MSAWNTELIKDLNDLTAKNIDELKCIVERMGIDNSTRVEWINSVKEQIADSYSGILEQARELQDKLIDSIEKLLQKTEELCKQLRIKMPLHGSDNLNLGEEKQLLEKRVAEYQNQIDERMRELNKLKKREKDACMSLGVESTKIPEFPLPTVEEIDKYSNYIESLENEKFKRESQFLEMKCKILVIIEELGIQPSLEIEKTVCSPDDSLFHVTDYNMDWLQKYYNSLVQQKIDTTNEIAQLREKICNLWEKLDEDIKATSEFLQKHTGISLATLEAFQQEVKRCESLKKANIEKFIKMMREELIQLWEKCHFSSSERDRFEFLHDNLYTEDLLMFHEIEIKNMSKYYEDNKEILSMLDKHEAYWRRKQELDEKAADPKRYKNRGGTLLKEEKERNGLTKKLRGMELELLDFAAAYEEANNKPFLSWGRSIPDIIEKTRMEYETNKKEQLSAKKQQRNLTPTPVRSGFLGSTLSNSKKNLLTLTPGSATPGIGRYKRKLPPTQMFSSSKKKTPVQEVPTIKINDKTLTQQKKRIRYSLEKKKRMEKIRRLSKLIKNRKSSDDSMDYDAFEKSMIEKAPCRSTLFEEPCSSALATPLPATPKGSRTPTSSRYGTMTRTRTYTKLKTVPGSNMDI